MALSPQVPLGKEPKRDETSTTAGIKHQEAPGDFDASSSYTTTRGITARYVESSGRDRKVENSLGMLLGVCRALTVHKWVGCVPIDPATCLGPVGHMPQYA